MDNIFLPIYLFLCLHITITGSCSDHEQESLAQEIELGKSFGGDKHPNIVNFLACVSTCSECLSSEFLKYHVESCFFLFSDIICRLRRGGGESGGGGWEDDIPRERRANHLSSVEYKGRNVEY